MKTSTRVVLGVWLLVAGYLLYKKLVPDTGPSPDGKVAFTNYAAMNCDCFQVQTMTNGTTHSTKTTRDKCLADVPDIFTDCPGGV